MNDKPKILQLNTVAFPSSGVGSVVHAIHNGAPLYDMQSFIAAGYGEPGHSDFVAESKFKYLWNVFQSRLWAEDGFLESKTTRNLNNYIKNLKPDIIHIHNLHGYYADLPSLHSTIKRLEIPVVLTLHDLWLTTGRCAHPACTTINRNCNSCKYLKSYPSKWITGRSELQRKQEFLKDCKVVAPCNWIADKVVETTGIERPRVIPIGINKNIFKKDNQPENKEKTLIAIATKWTEAKGVKEILRLADKLPEGWHIEMIGTKVPVHPSIRKIGLITDRNELALRISEARALICASHNETFGTTIAEAIACGVPVIVQQGIGPVEYVPDKRFVVDFSDTEAVIAAINHLDQYEWSDTVWGVEDMVDSYYSLFRSLL